MENWIKIDEFGDFCRVTFKSDMDIEIILEEKDVDYLMTELESFQFHKLLERCCGV